MFKIKKNYKYWYNEYWLWIIQDSDIAYRKFEHSAFAIGRYPGIYCIILAPEADSSNWYIAVNHPEMITAAQRIDPTVFIT